MTGHGAETRTRRALGLCDDSPRRRTLTARVADHSPGGSLRLVVGFCISAATFGRSVARYARNGGGSCLGQAQRMRRMPSTFEDEGLEWARAVAGSYKRAV
jgi:hypothetical protein